MKRSSLQIKGIEEEESQNKDIEDISNKVIEERSDYQGASNTQNTR